MRNLYDQRRRSLVEALTLYLGQWVNILGENAGIHLMVRLHTSLSDGEIVHRALQVVVELVPAQPYYLGTGSSGEFIFGYTELNESQIQEGICRLAQVLSK